MLSKKIFVTGIDTDVGKTIVSSILVELLQADYWKPVQSGSIDGTDTKMVQSLISNNKSFFHEESYVFKAAVSPHYAAELENTFIDENKIIPPQTKNNLIIEGAGGLFVPLNDHYLILDMIHRLDVSVVIVSKNYLGSINHTLSTIDALKNRNIDIAGIIFNGPENISSQQFILSYSGVKNLGNLPQIELNKASIKEATKLFSKEIFLS